MTAGDSAGRKFDYYVGCSAIQITYTQHGWVLTSELGQNQMTVDELRKALDGMPGDMLVAAYNDIGLSTNGISARVEQCAPKANHWGSQLEVVFEHSNHTPEEIAQSIQLFVIG